MNIRAYKEGDREAVEFIHFATGFLGRPMSPFLSDNRLWKEDISYYLDKEEKSIFLLVNDEDHILGYILGTHNDRRSPGNTHFVFKTLSRYLQSIFLEKKDRFFWQSQALMLWNTVIGRSGEKDLKSPQPAGHLHINLLPDVRGGLWGTKLLQHFEAYAKSKGATIIHADSFLTDRNKNTNFWKKNGFKEFDRVKTSIWKKQLPGEDIFLVCYAKKL